MVGTKPPVHKVGHSLPETLVTSLTNERSLSSVDSLVVLQSGQFFEGSATVLPSTDIGLIVRVVQHVLVKGLLEGECLATEAACIRGFS